MTAFWDKISKILASILAFFRSLGGAPQPPSVRSGAGKRPDYLKLATEAIMSVAEDWVRGGSVLHVPEQVQISMTPEDLRFYSAQSHLRVLTADLQTRVTTRVSAAAKKQRLTVSPEVIELTVLIVSCGSAEPSAVAWHLVGSDGRDQIDYTMTASFDRTAHGGEQANANAPRPAARPRLVCLFRGSPLGNWEAARGMMIGRDVSCAVVLPVAARSISRSAAYVQDVDPDQLTILLTNRNGGVLVDADGTEQSYPPGYQGQVTLARGSKLFLDADREVELAMGQPRDHTTGR